MTPEELERLVAAVNFVNALLLGESEDDDEDEEDDVDDLDDLVAEHEAKTQAITVERDEALDALERANRIIREQNHRLQGAYEASANLHQALHGTGA